MAYPNAGLPNELGCYDEAAEETAAQVREWLDEGLVNIVGGCCGTTPAHIAAIAGAAKGRRTAHRSERADHHAAVRPRTDGARRVNDFSSAAVGARFVNIGERTNVTGSAKFKKLILAGDYDAAVTVARDQVEAGAQIIDVNMDEALLDGELAMATFLKRLAAEPDIARVPVMIDSSKWSVIEAGLQCVSGKPIVNSISLKEGEGLFLKAARKVRAYGAAVVVMAFDETGQADTKERKVEICERAYKLLVGDGFPPEDIIFDPNVFAVATGIDEHRRYALDFIEAAREIRVRCPHVHVSGGLSATSASRSAATSRCGARCTRCSCSTPSRRAWTWASSMPASSTSMTQIDPELREACEDVILDRRDDATERLIALAERYRGTDAVEEKKAAEWRALAGRERLAHALVKGIDAHIVEDTEEARQAVRPPDRGDRRAADGRHERGRRPVRVGQDVPAPGGQVGAGDEAGGGAPASLHRGGEGEIRRDSGQGPDRHGHGQGRRSRHRQEHRRRGPAVQRLRRDRPWRNGAVAGHLASRPTTMTRT